MKDKSVPLIIAIIFASFLIITGCSPSQKMAPLQSGEAYQLVDARTFNFIAENVSPFRGRTRYLTSDYGLRVSKDSLISYLPFFGRATQAPMNPSESGIQFTSTDFSYKVEDKKNRKEVTIIPHDRRDIQQIFFVIFDNGTASLNVVSTFRDPISFNGHLVRLK